MNADHPLAQQARERMVREQLEALGRGITDPAVLSAMRKIPRHLFVPGLRSAEAYADYPSPIGEGQTISQPFIVARMTELLSVESGQRVLEIGTGCGYQAAVLAEMEAEVFTVEYHPALAETAASVLRDVGVSVRIRVGDGWDGWPTHAPYDRIIVTCAPEEVPRALTDQLADGGIMVLPVGPTHGVQYLTRVRKQSGEVTAEKLDAVRFVPML